MTEESGRRVGGSNALTGRVLVLVLDLRVGGFLRAGHQQSGDIDDSLELAHAVKEIEHRVIGTIKFHLERQFAIKIFAIDTFRRISAEFDTGLHRLRVHHAHKVVDFLIIRHDAPLDFELLLEAGKLAFDFSQPRPIGFERSEEHTSELQSQSNLVCRLLLEKKKKINHIYTLDSNT